MITPGTQERIYAPVARDLDAVIQGIAAVSGGSDRNPPEVEERLAHVLATSGKRVRPAITLLASRLWGRTPDERTIKMAIAVELLHIATLIHDDTVDSADTRRGRATASNLWGGNVAVLLGDYVFATSAVFVCETNSVRLIKRFAETIAELSRGELHEILSAWDPAAAREQYFSRIYDKTASLFSTAAESGAVLGEGDEECVLRLRDYGRDLGIAYQVLDDLLDFESTSDQLGKPAAHDISEGVLTLPAIIAMENGYATSAISDFFAAEGARRDALLPRVFDEISASGALEEARAIAHDYIKRARGSLNGLPPSESLRSLTALADFVRDRHF
ncbi:MAG: polyprenyl synthetase family protein [Dehalococcoidia bacterium]